MQQRTLTPAQAARRLGFESTETIYRWIRKDRFRSGTVVNLGTEKNPRYRISREEVERIEREGFGAPLGATPVEP